MKEVTFWAKFKLLMWKNFLLVKRRKLKTSAEIVIPVLFSCLLVYIRSVVKAIVYDKPFLYPPLEIINNTWQSPFTFEWALFYSPANPLLDEMMQSVQQTMHLHKIESFETEAEMIDFLMEYEDKRPLAGVAFDLCMDQYDEILPNHLQFKLIFPSEVRYSPLGLVSNPAFENWLTNQLFPVFIAAGPRDINNVAGGLPYYYEEKFITIQSAISQEFIRSKQKTKEELPKIMIQRFPYPPVIKDTLLELLKTFLPIIFFLSFVYPCINNIKMITFEKEFQLKEAMKIMGLPNWLHWVAWFSKIMLFMMITNTLITMLLTIWWDPKNHVSLFSNSDPILIWLFLFCYSISMTTFSFLISVIFTKANTAATIAAILLFIFFMPYVFTQPNYPTLSISTKLTVCLFHNTGMAYGFLLILGHETNQQGLRFNNIFSPVSAEDDFSVGQVTTMILIGALIHLILALYIEKVFPGKYGVPANWYFPFEFVYRLIVKEPPSVPPEDDGLLGSASHFERYPENREPSVQTTKLRKVFRKTKVALDGLTIRMYEDEITVLLGNNGAGKTTAMSMLSSMFPPTSGEAFVNGCEIQKHRSCIQGLIGLCPQHNILFDDLSVEEHIRFFSKLKGLTRKEIDAEVEKYITALELEPKRKALSGTLSGGQKRKLNVAVALCGGSKVVLFDEPTGGMDPAARRSLWKLLQLERKNRTMILSTHFMDEADVLGDRIAIMHNGQLKCYGSSIFLKDNFGTGYVLTIEKSPNCDVDGITNLILKHLPNVEMASNVAAELTYKMDKRFSRSFQKMLEELEQRSSALGIESFGISLTTLEDVFMKVIDDAERVEAAKNVVEKVQTIDISRIDAAKIHLNEGFALIWYQLVALMLKKAVYIKRNITLFIAQIMFPVIVVVCIILMVRQISPVQKLRPLTISMSSYTNNPITLFSDKTTRRAPSSIKNFVHNYIELFKRPSSKRHLTNVKHITHHIISIPQKDLYAFNERYLIGVTVNDTVIRAWFNDRPFHTAPLTIGIAFNALVKEYCKACKITVTNRPLAYTHESDLLLSKESVTVGFQMGTNLGFAMCFVASYYIIFAIQERVSKSKLLQFVSGVSVWTFWITGFIWDFCTFVFAGFVLILTLLAFQEPGWSSIDELSRLMVLILCFIWSALPFVYLLSFLYNVPSSGYISTALLGVVLGSAIFYIVAILEAPAVDMADTADKLTWAFLIIPHFALTHGFYRLNTLNSMERSCHIMRGEIHDLPAYAQMAMMQQCRQISYFSWDEGVGRNITFMVIVGAVLFFILFVKELGLLRFILIRCRAREPPELNMKDMDSDVLAEMQRIKLLTKEQIKSRNVVIKDMTKYFGNFLAVNQISVGIQPRECFGLLGVNGAGKTTAFRMLTGDVPFTKGDAWIHGISIQHNRRRIYRRIGYCPQFDALLDYMTGWETLKMYCLLRGIKYSQIREVSMKLALDLKFTPHIDKKTRDYSGGNKRKLSTAIALIGNPSVVYLDEPTTGMDPGAKRHLWAVMSRYRDMGKSIILTSHSMEECEALCTRLAIMVNGEFKCLGSTQRLKTKFSTGFGLIIQMKRSTNTEIDDIRVVKDYVAVNLPGAVLKEEYQGMLSYSIPDNKIKWSVAFGIMEEAKLELNIETYTLSQTSLEQVFLYFTKYQQELKKRLKV